MYNYADCLNILESTFGKDCTFVLATSCDNVPTQRVVDTFYCDGAFWIVTYATSQKVKQIKINPNVSLCNSFNIFKGRAQFEGHPLDKKNIVIRQKLIKAFEPWYFGHNNENDGNMCYIRVVPTVGFFHTKGNGYKIDFVGKCVETMPFTPQIEMIGI